MIDADSLLESARSAIQISRDLEEASDQPREHRCLVAAVQGFLQVSLLKFDEPVPAVAFLSSQGVLEILRRAHSLNQEFLAALQSSRTDGICAVHNDPTFANIAWLLGDFALGEEHLDICADNQVAERFPLSPFWAEYARALLALTSGSEIALAELKLRGYERRWWPYVVFVRDIINGVDLQDSHSEICASFDARNKDKRLTDWSMIDGDGKHPVKWDFRLISLISYAHSMGYSAAIDAV